MERDNSLGEREMGTEGGEIAYGAELPEGCIANILSLTSPPDACRLSLVSSIFRSAAESDHVWESFLPSDYQTIIARSDGSSPVVFALKELYFCLCHVPLLIDGGKKSFSLDKWSGKKCYMIAAGDLTIIWGGTPQYWKWTSLPESRFAEVAVLCDVCWLEIRGKIDTCLLSLKTTYAAYLVLKFKDAYGLGNHPADLSVGIIGGESCTRTGYLYSDAGRRWPNLIEPSMPSRERDGEYPKERGDGWLEIELGEYFNEGGEDGELEMSLLDVRGGNWKSGLIIEGIEIRPKEGN